MLSMQFALEIEAAMSNKVTELSGITSLKNSPVISLFENFQKEFLQLLVDASKIDVDSHSYPPVNETKLLGSDTTWQTAMGSIDTSADNINVLLTLWSVYTAIDKSHQFYQQAATNSPHPQTRLFFSSLSHVKKLLRRKLDGVIQIYYNHLWGELGFAPFLLGKD